MMCPFECSFRLEDISHCNVWLLEGELCNVLFMHSIYRIYQPCVYTKSQKHYTDVAYEQLSKHALPLYQPLTTCVPLNMWYQTYSAYLRTIYGHLRIIQQSPPQNNFRRNILSFFSPTHPAIISDHQRSSAIISGHFWLFPQSGFPSYKLVYWFIKYVYAVD